MSRDGRRGERGLIGAVVLRAVARIGGVAGPLAFLGAWVATGATEAGYSPVHDPISRLAAVDAGNRWAMTGGLVALGAGIALFGRDLRPRHPDAGAAAVVTAVSTLAVAATPLGSALGGAPHSASAALGYLSLAAAPLLAGRRLSAVGHRGAGRLSLAVGAASGACLAASAFDAGATGLWQRAGLTLGHAWIVAVALNPQWAAAASTTRSRAARQ